MIITIGSTVRKLRAWIGEMPDAHYPIAGIAENTRMAELLMSPGTRQAAVEYYRYTEHVLYGLLGATFTAQKSDCLLIQIAYSAKAGQKIDWSINPFYGSKVGLSSLMVNYVIEGATASAAIGELGPGVLRFDSSVEGPPIVMGWLAQAVITLLTQSSDDLTQEKLEDLMGHVGPPRLWYRDTANSM